MANVEGLDEHTKKKVNFFTRQYIDALAPSNFALTNPEVYRETIASGGQNLVKGLHNLLDDIERGNGKLKISMTDTKAFELGVNIATTPGKVVFQNDLMQLIQYEPATKKQWKRPLLVIPPWINKYYILDLREKNSFLRWAAGEGLTVFIISWVNPDEKLAHKNFEDYVTEGTLAALDAIEKATGEKDVNAIGYCLGGTLLAATLAWLAAKKQKRIATATFMTSLIDFTAAGELEVFIDEEQVSALEKKMNERGYLEGSEMAGTFNMLRANDLIWSFVINNYLLGRDPFPFDLLHWNCDSTRMPAAMHSFYLRNLYMKNLLTVAGRLDARRRQDRPVQGDRAHLLRVGDRGPHRAVEDHVRRAAAVEGQGEIRAVRVRAHRRHGQPAFGQQVRLLDERQVAGGAGRVVRGRQAARRLLVDRLAQMGRTRAWARGPGARFPARANSRSSRRRPDRTRACAPTAAESFAELHANYARTAAMKQTLLRLLVLVAASAGFMGNSLAQSPCKDCGVVQSVNTIQQQGQSSGVGMVAGGVVGGVVGHQIGSGRGNTVATIAGAGLGAVAGNQIEKNSKTKTSWSVAIRMDNGTLRTFNYSSRPAVVAGDRVKLVDGGKRLALVAN